MYFDDEESWLVDSEGTDVPHFDAKPSVPSASGLTNCVISRKPFILATSCPVDVGVHVLHQRSLTEVAEELGRSFAERASGYDDTDTFCAENYADLKAAGLVEAGVPREFGGGGAELNELASILRVLGRHCGSTALAFSMHSHQVAIPAWRWRHQKAPVEALLKRIAAERIILLSSGGSDWIAGSGKAERVEGGYRVTARKIFSSAAPAGDLLMTTAVLEEPGQEPMALHFGIPMNSPQVRIDPVWKTMGMRATGSHDVIIDGHIVPDASVAVKRKAGEWHPIFQVIATLAFPLIYAVYLGVAEGARDIAVDLARKRRKDTHLYALAGRMDTELRAARYAHRAMLDAANENAPSAASVNEVMAGRTLVGRHAIAVVELAMETAGGQSFFRDRGLERRFRDIQGARFHPMQAGPQAEYAGRMAFGESVDKVF